MDNCDLCGGRGYLLADGVARPCKCRSISDFSTFIHDRGFILQKVWHPKHRSPSDSAYIRRVVESKLPAVVVRGKRAPTYFYTAMFDMLKECSSARIVSSSDVVAAMMDDEREAMRLQKSPCLGVTLGFDTTRDIHEKMLANLAYGRVSAGLKTIYLFPFDTIRRLEGSYGTTFGDLHKDGYLEFVEIKDGGK